MSSSCACQAIKLTQKQQQILAQLSVIRAKDVDQQLRVNTSNRVSDLPETLFEDVPLACWRTKALQLIEQLLTTVPHEYHAQIEQLAPNSSARNTQDTRPSHSKHFSLIFGQEDRTYKFTHHWSNTLKSLGNKQSQQLNSFKSDLQQKQEKVESAIA